MSQHVLLAVDAGIATLTFNRPEVYNAMDADMMIQFRAAAELVQKDPAVRVVVMKGAGKAFLAGGDVALFHQRRTELPELIVRCGRELHFGLLGGTRRLYGPQINLALGRTPQRAYIERPHLPSAR